MKRYDSPKAPVLLVDDEPHILLGFSVILKSSGIKNVATISDSREVMPFLKANAVSLAVLDLAMPWLPGEDLLVEIQRDFPDLPVVIMTAGNQIETAVECMKNGAVDYLVKPVEKSRFLSCVNRALELRALQSEVNHLRKYMLTDKLINPDSFSHIITKSKKLISIFKYIEAISSSSSPVIITGETGTGKELVANAIHKSGGSEGEFVAVNVAGLDDTMFSDTLFGHTKGAFTDAQTMREGLIARAKGGTLFLDEIGDLNLQSQVKMLRLLQENEYYPLGSDVPSRADTRIIVATNRDLKQLITENRFREDLYYRLRSHHIHLPPLRERLEDIPVLLGHLIERAAHELGKKPPTPAPQLSLLLATYDFPGNVRELESLVYDAVSQHHSGILSMAVFEQVIRGRPKAVQPERTSLQPLTDGPGLDQVFGQFPTLKQMESYLMDDAMNRARGNQGIAASLLGITRQALNKRLNRPKRKNNDLHSPS